MSREYPGKRQPGFAQKVVGDETNPACGAADSIKPGVERSGTPGTGN